MLCNIHKLLCIMQHVQQEQCTVKQDVLLYPAAAAAVADRGAVALPALPTVLLPLPGCTAELTGVSRFMPTSRRLVQFSEGKSAPEGASHCVHRWSF